jgi:acetyltransferase-like isoleucine patch superfamily enzyme
MIFLKALKRKIDNKLYHFFRTRNYLGKGIYVDPSVLVEGSFLTGDITIGEGCLLHEAYLEGKIHIGRYTSLWGPDLFVLASTNGISIGSFCSIGKNVSIQETYHNMQLVTTYMMLKNVFKEKGPSDETISKGPITIGNDVWIGSNSIILSNVTIGNGAVIGAGSIVTKDVPAFAVVAGNPAKFIKWRHNQETQEKILKSSWWDWPVEKIKKERDFFTTRPDNS